MWLAETGNSLKGSVGVGLVELLQNTTKPYFMHYSCVCDVCSLKVFKQSTEISRDSDRGPP